MQLDLFAELRALQRHALVTLGQRCLEADFTDCDAVFGLQVEVQATRNLLHDCVALEAQHLYPLLGREQIPGLDLAGDRRLVHEQFNGLRSRLDGICEHVHRNNPVWRSLLTQEGQSFGRRVQVVVHAYLLYLECEHAATTAVSLRRGIGILPAAQRPLAGALVALKESHHAILAGFADSDMPTDEPKLIAPAASIHELLEGEADEALALAS